ncbi:MAG: hypothetical protein ABII82_05465 [Verrucomicrobiota bacterium]
MKFLITEAEWEKLEAEGYSCDDLDCDGDLVCEDDALYQDTKRILGR